MDSLEQLPLPFYLCIAAVAWLLQRGWQVRIEGWGIPLIAVTATAGSWYLIDPIYNDYTHYVSEVGADNLSKGFWEVLLFFISLGFMAPAMNRKINGDLIGSGSQVIQMMRNKEIEQPYFQDQVEHLSKVLFSAWAVLMAIALFRTNFNFIGLFFPYLGELCYPWSRDRIGSRVQNGV